MADDGAKSEQEVRKFYTEASKARKFKDRSKEWKSKEKDLHA